MTKPERCEHLPTMGASYRVRIVRTDRKIYTAVEWLVCHLCFSRITAVVRLASNEGTKDT